MVTTRERIARLVRESPGLSATSLGNTAGLDDTTVSYHLRRLARENRVVSEDTGRERVWFARAPGCAYCPVLRRAIPLLRRETPRSLAHALGPDPRSIRGLALTIGLRPGAVRRAAEGLEEAGLVERNAYGHVQLREGAEVCREKALASDPCPEWGRCPISRTWPADPGAR